MEDLTVPPFTTEPPQNQPPNQPDIAKRIALGALLIAGFSLIGLIVAMAWPGSSSKNNSVGGGTKTFQNWLKPTSEIMVGDARYVSPCSIATPEFVDKTFGPLNEKTAIQENYLDHSIPASEDADEQRVQCNYNHIKGSGPDVSLEITEQPVGDGPSSLSRNISFDEEDSRAELAKYRQAVAQTKNTDKDIATLLDMFETSLDYQKVNPYGYPGEAAPPKNYILPISGSISGLLDDFTIAWQQGNFTYKLGHSLNVDPKKSTYSDYSNQEIVAELKKMSTTYNMALEKMEDKNLDQSPAPTILGTSEKFGSTTILEPCAIMTRDVFTKITGKEDTEAVKRTSVSINAAVKQYTQKDKQLILPGNDCGRQTRVPVGFIGADNTYATFSIDYGSSTNQAKAWLEKNYKFDEGDIVLNTDADWAGSFQNPFGADKPPLIEFRVGPYICNINIYTSPDEGDDIEATTDQYVTAINALTASLKQNIASIEE